VKVFFTDGIRRKVHRNYLIFYRIWRDAVEILLVLQAPVIAAGSSSATTI
jgi:hypothetical protein